ncbi:protein disulfide-isomerase [Sphaerisporangium krabiense]|uniref:Putative DsbA family dithiol-disulfide isomerase n=1 Tax=Sphaerisporangium krabiense TaxID=763782 RepID=A0A7W8Z2J5_9ACTN|nr:DsbA family oxidoreductase [Sphaerisporangium krabiense]MBB5626210.1 putative DsbA family dithiol-disulfide isomerase [Sphaerisporangium krabiense]GII66123.1 protein disulfide-isomerase [Sphaerisporangium krabiense]
MKVQIWADVICPWCGIGRHRLKAALERFEHADEVEVVHRSFQLDPGAPAGVARPVAEMLTAKYGMDPAQVAAMNARVEELAHAEGLKPYIVADNVVGSTALAHEFLAHATAQGMHTRAWDHVLTAYWGEARPVFTVDALVSLGEEIGLDPAGTREALTDRRHRSEVEREAARARALGATGVPFTVVGDRYGLAGAQDPETVLDVLRRAWDDAHRP